jgi:cytochrome oxidase Cu insertion factor (SCO1/SenC/PrrC family)
MRRIVLAVGLALLMLCGARPAAAQENKISLTQLKVGDVAPDFTLLANNWKPVKLSDYRGRKNVVLAFYVLAFTGG